VVVRLHVVLAAACLACFYRIGGHGRLQRLVFVASEIFLRLFCAFLVLNVGVSLAGGCVVDVVDGGSGIDRVGIGDAEAAVNVWRLVAVLIGGGVSVADLVHADFACLLRFGALLLESFIEFLAEGTFLLVLLYLIFDSNVQVVEEVVIGLLLLGAALDGLRVLHLVVALHRTRLPFAVTPLL
jgi:hypothetical protein